MELTSEISLTLEGFVKQEHTHTYTQTHTYTHLHTQTHTLNDLVHNLSKKQVHVFLTCLACGFFFLSELFLGKSESLLDSMFHRKHQTYFLARDLLIFSL